MALIKCPSCGRDISDKAKKCPGCGWIPGSEIEEVKPDEKATNSQNVELDAELEQTRQKNKQLENEIGKLNDKITELNNGTQEIGNLKKLIVKLNNEKSALEKQLQKSWSEELKMFDSANDESIQQLQGEYKILKNENERLQEDNARLAKQIQDISVFKSEKRENISLIKIVILFITLIIVILFGFSVITQSIVKNEFAKLEINDEIRMVEDSDNDEEDINSEIIEKVEYEEDKGEVVEETLKQENVQQEVLPQEEEIKNSKSADNEVVVSEGEILIEYNENIIGSCDAVFEIENAYMNTSRDSYEIYIEYKLKESGRIYDTQTSVGFGYIVYDRDDKVIGTDHIFVSLSKSSVGKSFVASDTLYKGDYDYDKIAKVVICDYN